jgi:hypothetical protein
MISRKIRWLIFVLVLFASLGLGYRYYYGNETYNVAECHRLACVTAFACVKQCGEPVIWNGCCPCEESGLIPKDSCKQ